jgi:Tfp pilus assembly protein PilN
MALHLNLYHEVIKAKALKRRDPLKISLYALAGIVAICTSWYIFQVVKTGALNAELAQVKAEFDKIEPSAKEAQKREEELSKQAQMSALLEKRMEGRFYWAPVLADIMQVVPREVQITRLGGDVSGEGLRRCAITIDGLSAGADPRRVAEELRTALADKLSPNYKNVSSTFKMLEDGTEMVMLDGKQMATATFAINVQLFTGEEKPAAPVRIKK